jgi:glycosyltransferase involved in cell wall biosynthesis
MSRPKVSIITVSFNEEEDIAKTCDSVAGQVYKNYEWLVIDGGSTDKTVETLHKYKKNISTLVSERDNGIYDGMNKGIKLSKGEYLLFLNAGDCFANKNVLKDIFEGKIYKSDIIYGDCLTTQKDGSILNWVQPDNITMPFLCSFTGINHQSAFIKQELFEKYGGYDTSYKSAADSEKWCCFLKNGCIYEKVNTTIALVKGYDGMSSDKSNAPIIERERSRIITEYCENNTDSNNIQRKFYSRLPAILRKLIGSLLNKLKHRV